jgi:hypothetical protein
MTRLNNEEACFVCCRRSDGVAVGYPAKRLGWYCNECGPVNAWKALFMEPRHFDTIERQVISQLAEEICSQGWDDLQVPANEVPQFLGWLVKEFADRMREVVNGKS